MKTKNLVECKRCDVLFDYSPGPAGNARQLCKTCRELADDEEVKAYEEEMILENNKYIGKQSIYDFDPVDILFEGNVPKFSNEAEMFMCAKSMGEFVSKNGFFEKEDNIIKFAISLGFPQRAMFAQCLNQDQLAHLKTISPHLF